MNGNYSKDINLIKKPNESFRECIKRVGDIFDGMNKTISPAKYDRFVKEVLKRGLYKTLKKYKKV